MSFDRETWYKVHRKERLEYLREYYRTHLSERKSYRKRNKSKIRKYDKEWREKNQKRVKELRKKHYWENREEERSANNNWCLENKNKRKKTRKKFLENHPGYEKKYTHSPKGREKGRRHYAKRKRKLGYIPLNKPFKGSRGHHVDKDRVIYIPKKMHGSVWHSVLANRNMDKINRLAFEFLRKNG